MTFDTTFLLFIALVGYGFAFLYLFFKKKISFSHHLLIFGVIFCYVYLINQWNFPLIIGASNDLAITWSLIPFYNLYYTFMELRGMFFTIFRFSFTSVIISFMLGILVYLLKISFKKSLLIFAGIFAIEFVGAIQILNNFTIFKAFDTSILIVQFLAYIVAYYLTKNIVNHFIEEKGK
jgi:hypothetical protein